MTLDILSRLLEIHQDGEKLLVFFSDVFIVFCSNVSNVVLEMFFMLFNSSVFHVNLVTFC